MGWTASWCSLALGLLGLRRIAADLRRWKRRRDDDDDDGGLCVVVVVVVGDRGTHTDGSSIITIHIHGDDDESDHA